jgi:hypothetical protein
MLTHTDFCDILLNGQHLCFTFQASKFASVVYENVKLDNEVLLV